MRKISVLGEKKVIDEVFEHGRNYPATMSVSLKQIMYCTVPEWTTANSLNKMQNLPAPLQTSHDACTVGVDIELFKSHETY